MTVRDPFGGAVTTIIRPTESFVAQDLASFRAITSRSFVPLQVG